MKFVNISFILLCVFIILSTTKLDKKKQGERFVPGQIIETEFGPRFVPGKIHEVDGDVTFTPAQIVQTDQGMTHHMHTHTLTTMFMTLSPARSPPTSRFVSRKKHFIFRASNCKIVSEIHFLYCFLRASVHHFSWLYVHFVLFYIFRFIFDLINDDICSLD